MSEKDSEDKPAVNLSDIQQSQVTTGDSAGKHVIKGNIGPVTVIEQHTTTAPAPRAYAAAPPSPPAHFVGREPQIAALTKALSESDKPQAITALQGMGGIGKSALAAKLAAELHDELPGGVFWADLPANNGDPMPVLGAWARICGHNVSSLLDPSARANEVRGMLAGRVA